MNSTLPDTENPLRAGLKRKMTAAPPVLVIFGATGDLMRRKLMPALYDLAYDRLLPAGFSVVGVGRRDKDDDIFRAEMLEAVNEHARRTPARPEVWEDFARNIFYHRLDFEQAERYDSLQERLHRIDGDRQTLGNRIFYLATAPRHFGPILEKLHERGMIRKGQPRQGWTRVLVEKPFGSDLESARALNRQISALFDESQVYRIDHYLGKETVQNILVFRFANGIFEPIWNRKYVDHIQITVSEKLGMEGRGAFFDGVGVLRDMVQNHMLQLLSLVAMEPPVSLAADSVRDEKVKAMRAVRPMTPEEVSRQVARGQYGPGFAGGKPVPGYREEPGVAPDSGTETFMALKLFIDNWRWAGVPFYLRSGKRLPRQATELTVQFKAVPHALFPDSDGSALEPNLLIIRIQPDEAISLRVAAKIPSPEIRIQPVLMDFRYGSFLGAEPPDAYERLLLDVTLGEATLFTRRDEVEVAWSVVTPILEGSRPGETFPNYEAGTWGPQAAFDLIEADGRQWRKL
ncbi:MAG: glucose-6-phosphate dehydrogenase [Armatimonadetes bacterium]|nr:glucose-6-phosphate dehydrogenase [Armatimonadota bacterium]